MVVGIIAGTYSSIYVAAPLTEWIDKRIAKGQRDQRRAGGARRKKPPVDRNEKSLPVGV